MQRKLNLIFLKQQNKKKYMRELIVLHAQAIPEESLLNKMSEYLEKYKITKDKEIKEKLNSCILLFAIKSKIEKDGFDETLKDVINNQKINEMFQNKEN